VTSELWMPRHTHTHTCEGLERVHFEDLLADLGKVRRQLRADLILRQGFADLKYFVCDALWSRTWGQSQKAVRHEELKDTQHGQKL